MMKNIRKINCQYLSHCAILGRFQVNVLPSLINYSKEAPTSFLANQYFKFLLRVKVVTQNIWFFNYCLNHSLTLKYMKLKSANTSSSASKGIVSGIIRCIKEDRKIQYNKRDIANIYLKVVHTELLFRLHNI